jgi:hypothetical protein
VPFVLLTAAAPFAAAAAMAWTIRLIAAFRFRQPFGSALLHPVGVCVLLVIQWYSLARHLFGRPAVWKGRAYVTAEASNPATASGATQKRPYGVT